MQKSFTNLLIFKVMKESTTKEKKQDMTNKVHLHGYINDIKSFDGKDGKKFFVMDVATLEAYKDNKGEMQRVYTYHNVNLNTDDKAVIKKLDKIAEDLKQNRENRDTEGYKPKIHTASIDGVIATRKSTGAKNGVEYYNQVIITDADQIKLDAKKEEKEVRNSVELKGNIAKIDLKDNFAIIQVATHYYAPGEQEGSRFEGKGYHEETNYVETRVSERFRPETFEKIKSGEIAVGDLVKMRGQMHNTEYKDEKNDTMRYKVVVDLRSAELVAKKGQKKAEAQEEAPKETKKAEKKPAVKKAASRKKGMTM